mmetsp:Transcript_20992/g.43167  ORF Transcript_20992/g.43167 Transcript_20992/m.43167 type:complete len:96 (-) Transcript_20992:1735-2022(-)
MNRAVWKNYISFWVPHNSQNPGTVKISSKENKTGSGPRYLQLVSYRIKQQKKRMVFLFHWRSHNVHFKETCIFFWFPIGLVWYNKITGRLFLLFS